MYVYCACLFYVCCGDCVGVCGKVCCVAAVVKDSECLLLFTPSGCCECFYHLEWLVCLY